MIRAIITSFARLWHILFFLSYTQGSSLGANLWVYANLNLCSTLGKNISYLLDNKNKYNDKYFIIHIFLSLLTLFCLRLSPPDFLCFTGT